MEPTATDATAVFATPPTPSPRKLDMLPESLTRLKVDFSSSASPEPSSISPPYLNFLYPHAIKAIPTRRATIYTANAVLP